MSSNFIESMARASDEAVKNRPRVGKDMDVLYSYAQSAPEGRASLEEAIIFAEKYADHLETDEARKYYGYYHLPALAVMYVEKIADGAKTSDPELQKRIAAVWVRFAELYTPGERDSRNAVAERVRSPILQKAARILRATPTGQRVLLAL